MDKLYALVGSDASYNVTIVRLSFVFTSALSFLLLKERPNIIKNLGVCLAVLSIIVI